MAINLKKLRRALTRNKRVKGIGADRRLERAWVRYAVRYVRRVQAQLLRDIMPTLEVLLPKQQEGTTNDVAMEVAFENARRRFLELDGLKARADKIFQQSNVNQRNRFRSLLQRSIGVDFNDASTDPVARELVRQQVDETVDRIVTLNETHFDEFKRLVNQYVASGEPIESFRKAIKKAGGDGYPLWKVERIAVDQFLTLHGKITELRQKGAGITHYFWRTAGDARVRKTHQANDGKRFAWDAPPATGHPGEEIRCRCIADPDLSGVALQNIGNAEWEAISEERFVGGS